MKRRLYAIAVRLLWWAAERVDRLAQRLWNAGARLDDRLAWMDSGPLIQEPPADFFDGELVCPHGEIGSCNACDVASDFAYDSARERGRR